MNRWARKTGHLLSDPSRKHYSGFLRFYEKHLPELEAECLSSDKDPTAYYRTQVSEDAVC